MGLTGAESRGSATRPQGVLFFAGPTGVGKTESAKALAALLFQNQQRHLLRFDMNQYTDWAQAQRLVGGTAVRARRVACSRASAAFRPPIRFSSALVSCTTKHIPEENTQKQM